MQFRVIETGTDTIQANGTAVNSKGGTEMMLDGLMQRLPSELKDQVNIICSRVRGDLPTDKKNILWLHDLWNDPEAAHLSNPDSRSRFDKLVFVSNYQFQTYHMGHGVSYDESAILRNAIVPIPEHKKEKDGPIRLIYHTTPHRGLEILVPVFEFLYKDFGDDIVLDVYSSFDIYGWPQRNEQYKDLFKRCEDHPGINYHGTVSNDEIREALQRAHIFAYPSVWVETSCIAAIEAMSAHCAVVCPNYGALPETTAGLSYMYHWHTDPNAHAHVFASVLNSVIRTYWDDNMQNRLSFTKTYADNFFNWEFRINEWISMLNSLVR